MLKLRVVPKIGQIFPGMPRLLIICWGVTICNLILRPKLHHVLVTRLMDWMYSIRSLEAQLSQGHAYYIAFRDEKPCGYVSVQPEGPDGDGVMVWHLQKIYVMPSEQGRGLGRLLFETAVGHVCADRSAGEIRMELNVNRSNPAVGFYEHLGMKRLRQGDFHIGGGFYMNDYIMGMTF